MVRVVEGGLPQNKNTLITPRTTHHTSQFPLGSQLRAHTATPGPHITPLLHRDAAWAGSTRVAQKPRSAATDPSGATGDLPLPLFLPVCKYVTPPSACSASGPAAFTIAMLPVATLYYGCSPHTVLWLYMTATALWLHCTTKGGNSGDHLFMLHTHMHTEYIIDGTRYAAISIRRRPRLLGMAVLPGRDVLR
jgi:hypothetical protein